MHGSSGMCLRDRRAHVMQVFINGALDSTATDSTPLTIGNEAETGWPDHSPFRGRWTM